MLMVLKVEADEEVDEAAADPAEPAKYAFELEVSPYDTHDMCWTASDRTY